MLEGREVTVKYGSRIAVEGATLQVSPGEVTAVIGPNGAGKSTLLQTLNGRLQPVSGSVLLDEKPLEKFNRRSIGRRIAVVAQEAELRFPITVLEFVLGGRYAWATNAAWGWETENDLRIAEAVLTDTELSELSGRLMNQLSGGERQRAVLARALATEATYLLLDEPTANLDLAHQSSLLKVVRKKCKTKGAGALVVTHEINLAAQFADKVVLMKSGKVVEFGNPTAVITPAVLKEIFEIAVLVDAHPVTGAPRVTPVHK